MIRMTLRKKLFLFFLVLLLLPWSSWRLLKQMELSLRQDREQALTMEAQALARFMELESIDIVAQGNGVYVHQAEQSILLDGYAADWQQWAPWAQEFYFRDAASGVENRAAGKVSLMLAEDQQNLFAMVIVEDEELVWSDPRLQRPELSDHLVLSLTLANSPMQIHISSSGPGWVAADSFRSDSTVAPKIEAYWQDTINGYSIELKMAQLSRDDRFGFNIVNVNKNLQTLGAAGTGQGEHGNIVQSMIRRLKNNETRFSEIIPSGTKAWLINKDRWVLDSAFTPLENDPLSSRESYWLEVQFYRWLLGTSFQRSIEHQPEMAKLSRVDNWRYAEEGNKILLTASATLQVSNQQLAVELEQGSDSLLLLVNRTLGKYLLITILSIIAFAIMIGIYAGRLSVRIRKLRDAVQQAVSEQSYSQKTLPNESDYDEIGDLSRVFSNVLTDIGEYNYYLQNLAGRLSHELRTPLAVVKSSLENLNESAMPNESKQYLSRATDGVDRLSHILHSMSAARRMQEAVDSAEFDHVDLALIVESSTNAYRELHSQVEFAFEKQAGSYMVYAADDLISQLLDKLVDNAVSFTKPGGLIRIQLRQSDRWLILSVANPGPLLPKYLNKKLFQSMVSVRNGGEGRSHWGLGLYIVKLIANCHHGRVFAENLEDASGVRFVFKLKAKQRRNGT